MSDVQSQDEFEVLHRSTCKDLKIEQLTLEQLKSTRPVSPVVPDLLATLTKVISLVSPEGPLNADAIFRNGLQAMALIDAKRFVLDNLLENLKRGDKPKALIARFRQLGLLDTPATTNAPVSIPSDAAMVDDVDRGRGALKRWAFAVAQIAANAVRSVPKFVEIEPSLSLVGPIPVLSFALKGKGMSIHELFEALRAAGRYSSLGASS